MDILKTVQKLVESEGIKVSQLAKEAGIKPADKIYKWFDERGNPKGEDYKKLEAWLDGKKNKKVTAPVTKETKDEEIQVLQKDVKRLALALLEMEKRVKQLESKQK